MTEPEEIRLRSMFLRTVRNYLTEETDSIPEEEIEYVAHALAEELYLAYEIELRRGLD